VPNIFILSAGGISMTILTSEITYRWIELPGIAIGKHIANAIRTRTALAATSVN
jgi:hypothetical protein